MANEELNPKPVMLVVMGISGSGKSTVGRRLAAELCWEFAEGDELHSAGNVAKMASGTPLTDDDRWPWLAKVADWMSQCTADGKSGVVTCSALKRSYRDVLRGPLVTFVYLAGAREQIADRMASRTDHFMPEALLDSQLSTLEPPQADEQFIAVDVGPTPSQLVSEIIRRLSL